jgi:hypothetical protein
MNFPAKLAWLRLPIACCTKAVIPHRKAETAALLRDMRELRGMSVCMQVVYHAVNSPQGLGM